MRRIYITLKKRKGHRAVRRRGPLYQSSKTAWCRSEQKRCPNKAIWTNSDIVFDRRILTRKWPHPDLKKRYQNVRNSNHSRICYSIATCNFKMMLWLWSGAHLAHRHTRNSSHSRNCDSTAACRLKMPLWLEPGANFPKSNWYIFAFLENCNVRRFT